MTSNTSFTVGSLESRLAGATKAVKELTYQNKEKDTMIMELQNTINKQQKDLSRLSTEGNVAKAF